jgi:hypothetical protein
MKINLLLMLGITPVLVACSSAEDRRNAALDMLNISGETASGTVKEVQGSVDSLLNMGKSVTDGVTDMVEDAQKRINQVQSGVNMLLQGKELIESGVKGDEE